MIWQKKYRSSFLQKLGISLPALSNPIGKPSIWVHAVSMGETRCSIPLIKRVQKEQPNTPIFFSASTETGIEEAKRALPGLQGYFLLPIDFSWNICSLKKIINPFMLILVESDFWYNLISSQKRVVLVNGKISERSTARFKKFPFFCYKIFSCFDYLGVQSKRYKDRFLSLGIDPHKIVVTGNLKCDFKIPSFDEQKWREKLGIDHKNQVVVIGSTHDPEEKELLEALIPLFERFPNLKIILVPRHPERFSLVENLIAKQGISFSKLSQGCNPYSRIILIDTMGVLNQCYKIATVAIVAGSFNPKIGGHNILEPISLGIPTLFGPYMEDQKDLVELALQAGAGKQVKKEELATIVTTILNHPPVEMIQASRILAEEMQGSTEKTWEVLQRAYIQVPVES